MIPHITACSRRLFGPVLVISMGMLVPPLLASCDTSASIAVNQSGGHHVRSSVSHRQSEPITTTTVPPPRPLTMTTPQEQPGWTPVAMGSLGVEVDARTITAADGSRVVIARFIGGQVTFDLHVGSSDPPTSGAPLPAEAGPSFSPDELPLLLGAFNGGFMSSANVGGFEVDGHVLKPLVTGMASFVIDADGSGHVGAWGVNLPLPGEQVMSVRQNLPPLIVNGFASPQISSVGAWGATVGGSYVARSALGEDWNGDILYAGSMSAVPSDLASALITCGAVSGMQLDINPMWIDLTLRSMPSAALTTMVPGQNRSADQYVVGWARDFVAVLASP